MTEQEFNKLRWDEQMHISCPTFRATTFKAINTEELFMCKRVPYNDGEPTKRGGTTHYKYKGIVYKDKKQVIEAINK